MNVHFICRGNTFRSRLAESYAKSLSINKLNVTSSGVGASRNVNGPICWYAKKILEDSGINHLDKKHWDVTSEDMLDKSDLIIFLDKSCYDSCVESPNLKLNDKTYKIWNIGDIETHLTPEQIQDRALALLTCEKIYSEIKDKINDLFSR